MMNGIKLYKNNRAFSLVELMVSMAIFGVIISLIVNEYTRQQDSQITQTQVVQMQQNIRSALIIMTRDIQMAGFDPEILPSRPGIVAAGDGSNGNPLIFTYNVSDDGSDNNNDGTIDESGELQTIQYSLYDAFGDGDMDIGRTVGAQLQPLVENIQTLQFIYLNSNGGVLAPPVTLSDIRAIQVAITATTDIGELRRVQDNRTITAVINLRNIRN